MVRSDGYLSSALSLAVKGVGGVQNSENVADVICTRSRREKRARTSARLRRFRNRFVACTTVSAARLRHDMYCAREGERLITSLGVDPVSLSLIAFKTPLRQRYYEGNIT